METFTHERLSLNSPQHMVFTLFSTTVNNSREQWMHTFVKEPVYISHVLGLLLSKTYILIYIRGSRYSCLNKVFTCSCWKCLSCRLQLFPSQLCKSAPVLILTDLLCPTVLSLDALGLSEETSRCSQS